MGILGCLATFHSIWHPKGDPLELPSLGVSGLESEEELNHMATTSHFSSPYPISCFPTRAFSEVKLAL